MKLQYGETAGRIVSGRIADPLTTVAALRLVPNANCVEGQIVQLTGDSTVQQGAMFRFSSASALTDDGQLVIAPPTGTGRWLRMPGDIMLALPFTFATADAAALLTLQAGMWIEPWEFAWRIDVSMTGGASSAIGVSSGSVSGHTTKGDLLGGTGGDVAATLVASASPILGTIGQAFSSVANRRMLFKPTDTVRYDRITSAFTAGSGAVLFSATLLKNDGA